MTDLWIANTVTDLIEGDVREHLPLDRIPLQGDVLGLGTTTSLDNGELSFLPASDGTTTIWKGEARDGSIRALRPGDGSAHFPYVCFSGDARALRTPVDLQQLGPTQGRPLQELVGEAIGQLQSEGRLPKAPLYGLRLLSRWQSLVITVSSKLCMGQQRRNLAVAPRQASAASSGQSIYDLLQHYRLASEDPGHAADPIRYLGASLEWECCGFWDTDPQLGRVTVPVPDDHLHLHGCSTDLRYGGHLRHEHPESRLAELLTLSLYPLQRITHLASDLGVEQLRWEGGALKFTVANRGGLDISDVGVAVVIDDVYSSHRYLRLPWLNAGAVEAFSVPLPLPAGQHRLEVRVDPNQDVLEAKPLQANNRAHLDVLI